MAGSPYPAGRNFRNLEKNVFFISLFSFSLVYTTQFLTDCNISTWDPFPSPQETD